MPQLIMDSETNTTKVTVYDWKSKLGNLFRKIPNISKYKHFAFSSMNPGKVSLREFPNSPIVEITILSNDQVVPDAESVNDLDRFIITPAWYLYEHIRKHCDEDARDVTCPKPLTTKPKSKDILGARNDNADEPHAKKRKK